MYALYTGSFHVDTKFAIKHVLYTGSCHVDTEFASIASMYVLYAGGDGKEQETKKADRTAKQKDAPPREGHSAGREHCAWRTKAESLDGTLPWVRRNRAEGFPWNTIVVCIVLR